MRLRKPLTFSEIPSWAIGDKPDRYSIASAFALAELTNKWVRLSADTQRAVFGCVLFGKCELLVSDDGIRSSRKVCFGTDFDTVNLDWSSVERRISVGKHVFYS